MALNSNPPAKSGPMWQLRYANWYWTQGPGVSGAAHAFYVGGHGPYYRADFQPGGQYYHLFNPGNPGGGTGGAGGGGGGAPAATNPFNPQPSGAHVGMSRGPVEQGDAQPERSGMFLGINTAVPETQMRPGESPWCKNVHGARPYGAISFRRGCLKLKMDRDTVTDGTEETCTITCVAKVSYAADTDYILITKPNGDTHAFWFDTTGSDTEPAGSQAADLSNAVDISGDTTDDDVATTLYGVMGALASSSQQVAAEVVTVVAVGGPGWHIREFVTNAGFTVTPFVASDGAALHADYGGLSLEPLEGTQFESDAFMLLTFQRTQAAYIGDVSTAVQCAVVKQDPLFGRQRSLENVGGMTMTLADAGSGVLTATVTHPRGGDFGEVVAVTLRYSSRGQPLDVDGNDDASRASTADTIDPDADVSGFLVNADRGTWDGESQAFQTTALPAGTYMVTGWAHSREGTSLPVKNQVVIA